MNIMFIFLIFLLAVLNISAEVINGARIVTLANSLDIIKSAFNPSYIKSNLNSSSTVQWWLTESSTKDASVLHLFEPQAPIHVSIQEHNAGDNSEIFVNIKRDSKLQRIIGYGAGLPQASAKVLLDLKVRKPIFYTNLLHLLFGKPAYGGAGMNVLRFPVGSCDFSMTNTSYDEVVDDYDLTSFSIDSDSALIVEVLKDVHKLNPSIVLIASPWSAPSWMKVLDTLLGVSNRNTLVLDERVYSTYAKYLVSVISAFRSHGLHIRYITLQNEPLFGDGNTYPGMYLSAADAQRLAKYTFPLLKGFDTEILSYDHNWDHPEYPLQNMKETPELFAGVAWHCYGGDMVTAHELFHDNAPVGKIQLVTECTGSFPDETCDITQGMTGFGWNHEWDMQNILLGAAAHYSAAGVKWILALDEHCGPTLPDVGFTYGRPLVSIPSDAESSFDIKLNQDFWSLTHMSAFLNPSISTVNRILSSTSGDGDKSKLIAESFVDNLLGTTTMIAQNMDHEQTLAIQVTDGDKSWAVTLPPFSTSIFQWKST